jgi:hypothetical protein
MLTRLRQQTLGSSALNHSDQLGAETAIGALLSTNDVRQRRRTDLSHLRGAG